MAKIKGVNVTGTIVPTDTTDTYPVIDPLYGIDGWRSVADHATRDAITSLRLRQGMIVYTANDGIAWQWSGSAWVQFGGGSGSVTSVAVTGSQGVAISGTVPITTTGTVNVGLGNITPTSVAASGTVTGSNLSGTNTGDQTITLTGDVTGSGTGTFATTIAAGAIDTATLSDGSVTFPKIANLAAHTLMGNATGSPASPEEITLGTGLAFSGTVLSATGSGGTVTSITAGSGLSGGTITTTGTIALSTIGNNSVLANISGGSAVPTSIAATALVDSAFGSAQGSVLYRGSSSWAALAPGTDGQVLTTHGAAANPTWTSAGGTVTSIATGSGLTGGPITGTGTISLAAIANHTVLANISGGSNPPGSTTLTALIDDAIGSTQGDILYRGASAWSVLAPGTSGQFLQTQGASASPQWAGGGTGTVTSITCTGGVTCTPSNPFTSAGTILLASVTDGQILANISGVLLNPTGNSLSDIIDHVITATQGSVLYRSATAWSALTPGTSGQVLTTQGASANPNWTSAGMTAIADHRVLANISGGSALPVANTLSDVIDNCIASTQGDVLYRNASGWVALAPGTSGNFLQTQGASANPQWAAGNAGTVTSIATGTGLTGGPITGSGTISLATIPTLDLLANSTGGTAAPAGVSLSAYLDAAAGTGASILARINGTWTALAVGDAKIIQGTSASAGIVANTMSGDATIDHSGVITVSKIGGSSISLPLSVANGGTGSANGAASSHSFGVSGTPNVNDVTPPLFLDRACTCDGLTIAAGTAPSGGSLTVQVQTSTDGVTWSSLASGSVSATTGNFSGTAACTTAISANTYLRGKFTAVNSAADVVCMLFIRS